MKNQPDMPATPRPSSRTEPSTLPVNHRSANARLLNALATAEHVILYLVSLMLLAVGVGILAAMSFTIIRGETSGAEKIIVVIEELLLVLIVLEIFVTVQTHLEGGRLQLEPFIIVGVIAIVRHILSVVVRLSIPVTSADHRERLIELAVYSGCAFALVAALALARWSQRPSGPSPDEQDSSPGAPVPPR
ncbi:phosphate-starvation-inducible PsiE family protein [Streptosporangium canum]|uniref:phosphate-starvation-inducible PsiE family protein n=1 Tax=Streptosporangium canum TaxID=324952 RepID=UPI00342C133B